ncbi:MULTISPECIES: serine hydrolase [unclassified Streptomyces]|uniref:serine hydrolase domain-containing protein n=1 Tax=unclassified Streptomyces TaxID=2593676 RepID=UPI001F040127|nr:MULTISPECIES: serine hydrolase domain-containing protein [unclassified Streptomyces]MCH0565781.1 beta-lactamase family protein [Streptomyces sp. MUM 2J]MCH0571036.1 beta-lactamase family protein [Streptomyces sp. MUM 136J]
MPITTARRTVPLRPRRNVVASLATAVVLLAGTSCSGGTVTESAGTRLSSERATSSPTGSGTAARLDAAVRQVMRTTGVPGVIVGLWMPGQPGYARAFGVADKGTGAPMTTDMHMRIGSETKTFTVTGILQLVDQGEVGLDDPVSRYVAGVPEGDKITLRDLARMQSGLFDYTKDPDFDAAVEANPERVFTAQELLDYSFRHPLDFTPGTQLVYCDTNTVLLGQVLEKVSGQNIADYLREHVLDPLGMDQTLYPVNARIPAPYAHGYTTQTKDGTETDATHWSPSDANAAGAMISTLGDLHVWAPVVATGTPLIAPATQRQRLQTATSPDFPGAGYGLGLFTADGWVGHNGSIPGYQSLTLYLPSQKATMVVLLNSDTPYKGTDPSTLFGTAVTTVATPGHVFRLGPGTSAPPSAG